ncbi:TetR/AcrR family transcriptional regulator [Brevundimonas sp. DWR2-3-1b1]|uniref:TetR/AcrR family transcriptional regulator n=1 Tax=unclassified Brevundimonas TaxID=2622653 RepID=UPI003CF4D049
MALRQAMLAFWRNGYETTSIADLTAAMGITAPSLYAAFGDKKQLFLEAVRLYAGDQQAMADGIDAAPSAFEAARALMTAAACTYTGEETPSGCLMASATASGSAASADVQRTVADIRLGIQRRLRARIDRDIQEKRLPPDADATALSGLVMAVMQGMSVLARDGAGRLALLGIASAALQAWPDQPR